ncbi:MAG: hypothetical protein AVDCRST_MAG66-3789 [uncultured Pseudonocardia sp.]|uniref:3-hydroxyacyl-[acyl-carrier-protein] dehydratase n=1 Tax=uncultured Pseudonocardia sp. TaxID=211455 RepID=A0A6J4Q3X8_9PSEU|nr:MAG: hypothetical protein AVDCRST_MAG66-3789 [uncultured Pseudonocardia sp.]
MTGLPGPSRIRGLLPHGHPMMLVDRVRELRPGTEIVAEKAVTASDACFAGLDAGAPDSAWVLPNSLVVESFGQAAVLLWLLDTYSTTPAEGTVPMLVVARRCRMLGRARPGDVLVHTVRTIHRSSVSATVSGRTAIGGRTIAEFGELMAVYADPGRP